MDERLYRIELTSAELNQLGCYVTTVGNDGWYFAPKKQFEARHRSIEKKINAAWKRRNAHSAGEQHEG